MGEIAATASPLEIAWTAVAVIGLLFSVWAAGDAYLDLSSVQKAARRGTGRIKTGGPRWWIAMGNLVSSALWAFVWLGFAVLGWVAMGIPTPPDSPETHSLLIGWSLVAMVLVLAVIQFWNRYVRIRLRRLTSRGRIS